MRDVALVARAARALGERERAVEARVPEPPEAGPALDVAHDVIIFIERLEARHAAAALGLVDDADDAVERQEARRARRPALVDDDAVGAGVGPVRAAEARLRAQTPPVAAALDARPLHGDQNLVRARVLEEHGPRVKGPAEAPRAQLRLLIGREELAQR